MKLVGSRRQLSKAYIRSTLRVKAVCAEPEARVCNADQYTYV